MGIVALQGAFTEHEAMLQKTSGKRHLQVIQVRSPEELKRCDALIIPGGGKVTSTFRVGESARTPWTSLQNQLPSLYLHVSRG